MKNRILYTLAFVFTLITSCSLDEDPKYSLNTQSVFSSEATTESVISQAYGNLGHMNLYGRLLWGPTIGNGTMMGTTGGGISTRATNYDVNPVDADWLTRAWKQTYKVISECNYLLKGLENSPLSEDYKERGRGHAYFLRGYTYYLIASLWGNAPIIIEPLSSKAYSVPLSSRKELYAQAERDLILAVEKLPEEDEANVKGIANKNAAKAYLAKLYFMLASQKQAGMDTNDRSAQELWMKVKEYGEPLVGQYALEPNFAVLFSSHLSKSKESIFQLNYTTAAASGVQKRWNQLFAPLRYSTAPSPSFRNIRIDKAFYDFHVGTHPNDARIPVSYLNEFTNRAGAKQVSYPIVFNKENKTYVNLRDYKIAGSNPKNPEYDLSTMPGYLKSYLETTNFGTMANNLYPFSGKGCDKNVESQYDTTNTILFRYADLLLILADAENELGNLEKSKEYVNQVLKRAKLSNVPSSLGQNEMRDFIFFERMFELVGEPVLYEDIRRRGTEYLKKVIKIHNDSWIINFRVQVQKNNNVTNNFIDILINNGNSDDENFLKKALLLPIPSDEINYNDKITQKDQNFGY